MMIVIPRDVSERTESSRRDLALDAAKIAMKEAVKAALEKAMPCENEPIRPQHIACKDYYPNNVDLWCSNCRKRKEILEGLK